MKTTLLLLTLILIFHGGRRSVAAAESRWRLLDDQGAVIKETRNPPRADGTVPDDLATGLTWLRVDVPDEPAYDPRTHELERSESVADGVVTVSFSVVDRPAAEIEEVIRRIASNVITERIGESTAQRRDLMAAVLSIGDALLGADIDLGRGGTGRSESQRRQEAVDNLQTLLPALAEVKKIEAERDAKIADLIAGNPIDLDAWPE